jgi:MerR family redox-sensitive transcriptional activator SoxR
MPKTRIELTIGQAAERVGVASSALRYWESVGLLEAPQRLSGQRRYSFREVRQIEMIALAKHAGFTLAEIRVILAGFSGKAPPSDTWCRLAARKLPEVEQTLSEATAMKELLEAGLRCECLSLEDCLGEVEGALVQDSTRC